MIALIDADILVYRVGWTTNDVSTGIASSRMREVFRGIMEALNTSDYIAYLTGQEKDNYRYDIFPEYKAGRPAIKPTHYQWLRDHLILDYGANVVNGMEADDALGIEQTAIMASGEHESTIVSIDKDLDQIPGWHYNFVKGILYRVEPLEGTRHFYNQLLQGDRVDNIQGIKGVGPKTSEKWLRHCTTEEEMFHVVRDKYGLLVGRESEELLRRNGRLLYIRTKKDQALWDFPI